jgi:hypothetical protein
LDARTGAAGNAPVSFQGVLLSRHEGLGTGVSATPRYFTRSRSLLVRAGIPGCSSLFSPASPAHPFLPVLPYPSNVTTASFPRHL